MERSNSINLKEEDKEVTTNRMCCFLTSRQASMAQEGLSERNVVSTGPIIRRIRPKYGLRRKEYQQIQARVMAEEPVAETIEALQQRLKMLGLMLGDCEDMQQKRKETHRRRKELAYKRARIVAMAKVVVGVSSIPLFLLLFYYIVFFR